MQSFDQHLVSLYRQGRISEETAIEFADSGSNVKIQIKTDTAGKKVASNVDWGNGLALEPAEGDGGDEEVIVADFGKV
jgi:twitching motility protein PilU